MIVFNLWKHHLKETKKVLEYYHQKEFSLNKIDKVLLKLGNNQFDLYVGNLTVKEIIQDMKFIEKIKYNENILFICKDKSLWIYKKIMKKNKEYIHFFPARKLFLNDFRDLVDPNLHLRIHSNSYKTLLLAYWFYLNKKDHSWNFFSYIEESRKYLGLSIPDIHKTKLIEKFISLFFLK
ncbi:MAG: hypothetical protein ACK4UJ_03305 [Leptonema sp. (in: bacteria)]